MAESNSCPVCGRELSADAPQGLCPLCLLKQGLVDGGRTSRQAAEPSSLQDRLAPILGLMPVVPRCTDEVGGEAPVSKRPPYDVPKRPSESGRYQLFDEIARGGMGAILKGRDPDLGRELAVKVLLEQHRERPDLVRRFIEEAQIGGQLQHPGIVPVHELGTFPDERPYFTMKLVRGRTLAALLSARGNLGDERSRFLAIFEQVCQTMAYAHSRAVIHRDLKPSNVMVGSFGEVQVMDWGLAKVLNPVGAGDSVPRRPRAEGDVQTVRHDAGVDISRVGSVLGTPAYMAPEQARGESDRVDERVDVFGLGAILCEILTGKPPYVGRDSAEVHELAVAANVGDAGERLRACGAEAELVSLACRCLSPSPIDRPRDAGEVAANMTAYLRGVQERLKRAELAKVEAQAKSAQEKTRRRLTVGLAAAIVALMASLGGGWTWREADRQRRAARVDLALRDVEILKAEAENGQGDPARWASAREAARAAARVLDDARDNETRARVAAIVKQVEEKSAQAEADGRLLVRLAEIGDGLDEEPTFQTDDAYAEAFRGAGLDVADRPPEELGLAIARRPARVSVSIASALDRWAVLQIQDGDGDRAVRLMAVARAADPDEWRDRLRAALVDPNKGTRLRALRELAQSALATDLPAATLALLGAALFRAGDLTLAEAVLRPAERRHPGDLWLALHLARTLSTLYRYEEAVRYYQVARALRPETAHSLGHALERLGETDEAIAVFREAIHTSPTKARNYSCLAALLRHRGLVREADEMLDTSIAAARKAIRLRDHGAGSHLTLGIALGQRGRLDESVAEFREVMRLLPSDGFVHYSLGVTRHLQGLVDDELAEFRTAVRLQPNNPDFHKALAKSLAQLGRLPEAIATLEETIRHMPEVADVHYELGTYLDQDGRTDDALDQYRQTIRLTPESVDAHFSLAHLLYRKGRIDQAIAECRETIRLKPDFPEAHGTLAFQLQCQGRYVESLAEFERRQDLGLKRGDRPDLADKLVEQARRLVWLEPKAEAIFGGEVAPADVTECLDLALIATHKRMYATAADLWTKAFAVDPRLAADPISGGRYNAACAAALAGCGKGMEKPPLDEPAKAKRRRQAFDWLKADLAKWSKMGKGDPSYDRDNARKTLEYWQTDIDLAGVREQDELANLPEAERADWQALWLEGDRLLTKLRADSHSHSH